MVVSVQNPVVMEYFELAVKCYSDVVHAAGIRRLEAMVVTGHGSGSHSQLQPPPAHDLAGRSRVWPSRDCGWLPLPVCAWSWLPAGRPWVPLPS